MGMGAGEGFPVAVEEAPAKMANMDTLTQGY